jgi:subtilase family serine protease
MKSKQSGLGVIGQSTTIALAALLALGAASAQAGVAPMRATQVARDVGIANDAAITVAVALKNRDEAGLKALIEELHNPKSPQFHKFLSSKEFHARFDPSAESVAAATSYFKAAGLSVKQDGHLLEVTGSAKAIQSAFGVALHAYEVPAHGKTAAVRFHAAQGEPTIKSAAVAANVNAVIGLDSQPRYAPNLRTLPQAAGKPLAAKVKADVAASGNPPQEWTVTDLAAYYNVNPLYAAGLHGEGKTIGIVTLASFTPSDAFEYWTRNGLTTDPNRITIVPVDGGSGPVSDAGGSGETTLDVQQSGGLAPAANMIVYEAPNTSKAFVTAFFKAVNDNIADSISVSWGSFEWFDTLSRVHAHRSNVVDLKAFNQIFMQAAAQGQTLIAAQGDEGSYEANRAAPVPFFNPVISVGAPASSPYITSAGGTTLPVTLTFSTGYVVTVPTEQAWGWSYLAGFCESIGYDPVDCGIWGVGGGGGVSSFFPLPNYQKNVAGMAVTEAGQSLTEVDVDPPIDYVDLPAGFKGRNVPDVSLNADPETGYAVDYTDETGAFGIGFGSGGTSFVAPQLNGIAALLGQKVGGRVGLLNYPIYGLLRDGKAYKGGVKAPLVDIAAGDTWFYTGKAGYDQTTGAGVMNVAGFADALVKLGAK